MMIDCREVPSESGCTLALYGEEAEVLRAAVAHAVDVHGHTDDDELREGIRLALRPATTESTGEGAFVQLIEFRTHRIEDFRATVRQWEQAIGSARTARWAITGVDRDHADSYVQIIEFPSYEAAMANSDHPATSEFADQLSKLCDGEPTFHNVDVRDAAAF
jgi:quinol monooxygenase YgiN/predicted small metal-binding protein